MTRSRTTYAGWRSGVATLFFLVGGGVGSAVVGGLSDVLTMGGALLLLAALPLLGILALAPQLRRGAAPDLAD